MKTILKSNIHRKEVNLIQKWTEDFSGRSKEKDPFYHKKVIQKNNKKIE